MSMESETCSRRVTPTVDVGGVLVGSKHPVVVQSMTNTDTEDIHSTATQIAELARAGSELALRSALEQRADAVVDGEVADVGVRLADAHEDDGLAGRVHERERRAHLVVDRVEFGEHDAVDEPRLARGRVLGERLVEAAHL